MVPTILVGPSRTNGTVSRIVSDGARDWVETWGPSGWERGGASIAAVLEAPPASVALMAELGIPNEAEKASVGDSTGSKPNPS